MITNLRMPSIPEIRKIQPRATDAFVLCDTAGLLELTRKHESAGRQYLGGATYQKVQDGFARGDASLAAMADKYLSKFEDDVFSGQGWKVTNSVVGACPNIGAYLAGNPMNMRQRVRAVSETAPLTIFLELTGSAGAIDAMVPRGAAMLALVRLLSNTRPVELWTCTTYGQNNILQMIACKIDTQPLDVARASYVMCSGIDSLQMGFFINRQEMGAMVAGGWAYGVPDLERKWAGEILRRILNPGAELLYLPAAHFRDVSLHDPEKWVREMLTKYSGTPMDEEAA